MSEITLTQNEEKILILLLFDCSIAEHTIKKILGWSDEVFIESRDSLIAKRLIHDLQKGQLQFGRNGKMEALKIQIRCQFPPYNPWINQHT